MAVSRPALATTLLASTSREKCRVDILGCCARGRQADRPFNHSTGKGWVAEWRGIYHDTLDASAPR